MSFITRTIKANDGTTIGYRQTGTGQGLIICHGGGRISQNYEKLAVALSGKYTVYIPDRRGRGLSGSEGTNYNLKTAAEDLIVVIKATSADLIFGHSAGGLIALEAMRLYPLKKLAVYEPPISINNSFPFSWLANFEKALLVKKKKRAMAISLRGLRVEGMDKLPLPIITLLINVLSLLERKKEKGTRMPDLMPTLVADIKMAIERESQVELYKNISIPVCLMAGSKSPGYFHQGIEALSGILKGSSIKIFDGFDHYSPEEKADELAAYLVSFYS